MLSADTQVGFRQWTCRHAANINLKGGYMDHSSKAIQTYKERFRTYSEAKKVIHGMRAGMGGCPGADRLTI
jgi:hypothetical protein